jgi:superfamily II DNA or RNA helicase
MAVQRKPKAGKKSRRLSRVKQPGDMSLEQWQVALRRDFGREQKYRLKNLGSEPIFSEFEVTNPESKGTYRVAVRGAALGENFCSCPDFAVNLLGTCKHIEFTLGRLGRTRKDRAALALGFRPEYSEVCLHYGAAREVVFRAGTACPEAVKRHARDYFGADGRLEADGFARFPAFLKKATSGRHEVRCYQDALSYIAQVRDRTALAGRIDEAFGAGTRSAALGDLVKTPLYPYQRAGVLFAAKAGRCLLADDMGLGKTIQAIAATEVLARYAGVQRVLVVSPTSLKHQWQSEIEKFTDREAMIVEGLLPRRAECYRADSFYKLTNYDVVHRDLEMIRGWQPELVILDEAQRIKNWKTRAAQSVKRLDSEYAFVLTGTPLENRLEELHSIVEFVDRFRLGPMYRFLAEHQHADETGRVLGYRNLSKISETLEPILLRRTKDKVLKQLPERLEKRFFVPMTPQQQLHHDDNRDIVVRIVAKWKRFGFLTEKDQLFLRIALQNMRMSCNSTYLLDQSTDHGTKADEMIRFLSDVLEDPSAKVVVFSQWVRMHELVVTRLQKKKWEHVVFHGGVPGPKRKHLVQQFKEDPSCRLFLSTDAGGVGLNLQNASVVVNLDQPWNPAVLEQRIGRVHRLGQHRPVRVVHFIAEHTIEQGMLDLLAFKKAMFSGVLDGGKDEVFLGGGKLKNFMETVEKATTSIHDPLPCEPEEPAAANGNGKSPAAAEGKPASADKPPAGKKRKVQDADRPQPSATPGSASQDRLWTDVLTAGAQLLENLTRAVAGGATEEPDSGVSSRSSFIARDEKTGQSYLKLPLPEPKVVQKIVDLVGLLSQAK